MTENDRTVNGSLARKIPFEKGPAFGETAPIMVVQFDGAMDAGSCGRLAVMQMLHSLPTQRVATFSTDELVDYRAHRPIALVDQWVTKDVLVPEVALDLLHDDSGNRFFLLHGPEPDQRWEGFADTVLQMVRDFGVEVSFSFYGIPAAVPHTRPPLVHLQSTDPDLLPEQTHLSASLQYSASFSVYLHQRLHGEELAGVTLISSVPFYIADTAYPRSASASLMRLAELSGLSIPVGDLERGADAGFAQISRLVESQPEAAHLVEQLEHNYDRLGGETSVSVEVSDDAGQAVFEDIFKDSPEGGPEDFDDPRTEFADVQDFLAAIQKQFEVDQDQGEGDLGQGDVEADLSVREVSDSGLADSDQPGLFGESDSGEFADENSPKASPATESMDAESVDAESVDANSVRAESLDSASAAESMDTDSVDAESVDTDPVGADPFSPESMAAEQILSGVFPKVGATAGMVRSMFKTPSPEDMGQSIGDAVENYLRSQTKNKGIEDSFGPGSLPSYRALNAQFKRNKPKHRFEEKLTEQSSSGSDQGEGRPADRGDAN